MVRRRGRAAGIETAIGRDTFRATGVTACLENGGTLEHAQQAFAEGFGSQADLSAEGSTPKADCRA
jgi:hypothetical protein